MCELMRLDTLCDGTVLEEQYKKCEDFDEPPIRMSSSDAATGIIAMMMAAFFSLF